MLFHVSRELKVAEIFTWILKSNIQLTWYVTISSFFYHFKTSTRIGLNGLLHPGLSVLFQYAALHFTPCVCDKAFESSNIPGNLKLMCTHCCDLLMCCSSTDLQARWNLLHLQEWDGGHEGSTNPTPCLLYAAGWHGASSSQPRYGRYDRVLHPNVESCSMRVPDNDPIEWDYCLKVECVICEVGVTYELKITSSARGTDMLTRWRGKAVFGGWA